MGFRVYGLGTLLHYLQDPKLWALWYVPYYGYCRIYIINRRVRPGGDLEFLHPTSKNGTSARTQGSYVGGFLLFGTLIRIRNLHHEKHPPPPPGRLNPETKRNKTQSHMGSSIN